MKSASRFRLGVRAVALFLALAFVFPPEAMARAACSALALLPVPMRCAAMGSGSGRSSPPRACCCATTSRPNPDSRSHESSRGPSVDSLAQLGSRDGCCCPKSSSRDAATAPGTAGSTSQAVAWIDTHASFSARVPCYDSSADRGIACSGGAGPPGSEPVVSPAGASDPAAGCMRHDLLARGVVGLLTDIGTARL
jgi:hypothetical protein